ncbi:MAG: glutamate racemase [Acidimicrobiia bacterium]
MKDFTPRIAVFDSGIGGTGVLSEIRTRAPWADIVYVADRAFGPYGERSLMDVRERTELLARYLRSAGVGLVVIACNSASAAALYHLRAVLPELSFVGMEPAVKPAIEQTQTGVIGVMATGATFQGELFKALIGTHGGDTTIIEQACPGLAAAVESGSDVGPLLDEFIPPLVDAGADTVVLGCTHYPMIADEISSRLPEGVALIDPAPAVATQTLEVARSNGIDLEGSGSTTRWTTESDADADDVHPDGWDPIDIPTEATDAVRIDHVSLSAVQGDITAMSVDLIVNAANEALAHGGGVALAIARSGGPTINEESAEWIETYGNLTPGVAALTSAGDMPAQYVAHVAGPIHQANQDNDGLLATACLAALDLATEVEARSVAMPAVSAGIYGYPPDEATVVLVETTAEFVSDTATDVRSVRFVGFDPEMTRRFGSAIRSLSIDV